MFMDESIKAFGKILLIFALTSPVPTPYISLLFTGKIDSSVRFCSTHPMWPWVLGNYNTIFDRH